jgi:hypothetical protein
MWMAVLCIGIGVSGLAPPSNTVAGKAGVAQKDAVLEIMSLESGDCSLKLEHNWGGIAANHVYFHKKNGKFEAVVEPSTSGVRVTFTGWEEHPFVGTAARIRVIYRRPGSGEIDFVAEAIPGGKIRVQPAGRRAVQEKKVSIRFDGPEAKYIPSHQK